jgi:hypothetical protein
LEEIKRQALAEDLPLARTCLAASSSASSCESRCTRVEPAGRRYDVLQAGEHDPKKRMPVFEIKLHQ